MPRLLSDLAPYRDELVGVAVESTYNWYWLVDRLMDHGYAMHLVNTTAIPQYDGSSTATMRATPCTWPS